MRLEGEGTEFVDLTSDERDAFVSASAPAIERARAEVPARLFDLVAS
jgi:hypothetical protein